MMDVIKIAELYPLGDNSFYLIHNCIKTERDSPEFVGLKINEHICQDCGKTLGLSGNNRLFFDEIAHRVEQSKLTTNFTKIPCTEFPQVIIHCVESSGSYSRLHKNCKVLKQKRGNYIEVQCLKCGQISPLAMNSFSQIKEDDIEYWQEHAKFGECAEI